LLRSKNIQFYQIEEMSKYKLRLRSKVLGITTTIIVISICVSLAIQNKNSFITHSQDILVASSIAIPTFQNVASSSLEKTIDNLEVNIKSKEKIDEPKVYSKIQPEPTKVSDQGTVPIINEIKTDKPVIFLGIDDGEVTSPETLQFFQDRKWPVTLFINKIHYDKNISYFKSILDSGANLGNHTMNHPNLIKLSYEAQKKEICDSQDAYQKDFGSRPKLFRPPFGNYNKNTQQVVTDCGMIAINNWKARVDEGKMWYQAGDKLNKGEIILMHFRPRMMEDLRAFEDEINKQGLEVGDLTKWLD
jgi:peptidoglycan/xylan/chitin deacetylase (PgdA/CDA1 family)